MADELKDILRKANKTKLIQLAVDSTINLQDNILSETEKDTIRTRAYKEGWDNELERATQKARDILMIGMEAEKLLYQAMYFLNDIKEKIEPTEKALAQLGKIYIKDYNEKTDKYETVVDKPKEELEKDVLNELDRIDVYKMDKIDGLLENYLRLFTEAKQAIYLLVNSKVGGYRLYKEADKDAVKIVLMFNRHAVTDLIDIADHLEWCITELEEYKPEILEAFTRLNKYEKLLFIDKEKIKELSKKLNKVADLSISKEEFKEIAETKNRDTYAYLTDKAVSEEYLFTGIDNEMREKLRNSIIKLTEYVKYGR
jgi:DNA-binding transcriptional MerR regulator